MKELHIGVLVISKEWGGAQEVVYQLVKGYSLNAKKVSLYLNDELEQYYSTLPAVEIHKLGSINKKNKISILLSYIKMRATLIKVLYGSLPDVIHAHLNGALYVYLGLVHKFKSKVVFTLHGPEIDNFKEKKSLLDYLILKRYFESDAKIISPSHWQVEHLKPVYLNKVTYIPNGVDTDEFKPDSSVVPNGNILFVGRFVELKGIKELLAVAKMLPQYNFEFVGTGPLASLISLPNTKNLGFKNRKELAKIYNEASLCCFPSHHENMPIVGLEAAACGKSIIGTTLGFSEYIRDGENGLIVSVMNVAALKTAVERLMQDASLRATFALEARKTALTLDWKNIVDIHLKLFESLI